MNIIDNIGTYFIPNNNGDLVILGSIPGYATLNQDHVNSKIPYFIRINQDNSISHEIGTATISSVGSQIIVTDRHVISSSNGNKSIDVNGNGQKEFYVFVNTANFNTAFNNVSIKDSNFIVDKKKTVYIVNVSSGYIVAQLPKADDCEAIELSFKTIGDGSLSIDDGNNFKLVLSGKDRFSTIVSTGKNWIELKDKDETYLPFSIQSENTFSALSDPTGDDRSVQYKNSTNFAGSKLYIGNNEKLLFGSSTESQAKHIISPTGNYATVFNQTKDSSDFIVYASGTSAAYPKNLYFSSDGRLGINMPSGVSSNGLIKPATIFHIINTICQEGIRLENKTACHPADITLYQNPSSVPTSANDGSAVGQISFKGKNTSNNPKTYAQIQAVSNSVSSSKGQINLVVNNNSTTSTVYSASPDNTLIKNSSSYIALSGINTNIFANGTVSISGANLSLVAGTGNPLSSTVNVVGALVANNELRIPYANQSNVLLSVDANKRIVPATGFQIPGLISDGKQKLLSTQSDGTVAASLNIETFWPYELGEKIGGKDVIWSRYPYRSGEVCFGKATKELQLLGSVPSSEFSVGDQIAIEIYNSSNVYTGLIYRNISEITESNGSITAFLLDQEVLLAQQSILKLYSVTKGGLLTNTLYTSGVLSDATAIVFSTRPGSDTIFNTLKKDINFTVYGSESNPALNIIANAALVNRNSGIYFEYATQFTDSSMNSIPPMETFVGSNGAGVGNSNSNNSANFSEAASTGVWSRRVTMVGTNGKPSYYGTYDQNGNAFEWVEDENHTSSTTNEQYICGGSWRSSIDSLRSYIPTPRLSGLDDIGFRICSKAGYSNDTINNFLTLNFVRVDDPENPSDTSELYTESYDNRFSLRATPEPISVNNLGVVNHSYNISKYEITNDQYIKFLNIAATGSYPNGLYDTRMSSSDVGGIARSGSGTSPAPYSYYAKTGMNNAPVVFVNYLSAIRFINWLNNGIPSGDGIDLENGAYSIYSNALAINKNSDQNYWLPSVHEWHKAAYYKPMGRLELQSVPSVTIRRDQPFEYASGLLSSLSVFGHVYADQLQAGANNAVGGAYKNILSITGAQISNSGITTLVNANSTTLNKIQISATGTIFTKDIIIASGINSDGSATGGIKISPDKGLEYLDVNGNTIEGGSVSGIDGGFVFKSLDGNSKLISSSLLGINSVTGLYYPALKNTNANEIIHNDENGNLKASSWFTVGTVPDNVSSVTSKIVSITSPADSGVNSPVLFTDRIMIGPALESYSGSILTHNGKSPAVWTPNDFLKAPGASWNRYKKRAVKIISNKSIQFVSVNESDGGTGSVSLEEIQNEFAYNETIAIVNQNRDVFYVKVANISLTDKDLDDNTEKDLFIPGPDKENLILTVCPPIPSAFIAGSTLTLKSSSEVINLGYAFSVQKGAYLDMVIEPTATNGFTCLAADDSESIYRFKPSTSNTISIRPKVYTAFNKTAEDIDFVVYGHRKTLYTRYESSLFSLNENGIPTGLNPAFRVHAHVENSVEGSVESGVIRTTIANNTTALGIYPDLKAKITVNTNTPYKIASLTGIKAGVILPGANNAETSTLEQLYGLTISQGTGVSITGSLDLAKYADLTINGTTYTSGLIAEDIVLGPVWAGPLPVDYQLAQTQKVYAVNYPLTINNKGQIVSLIPPPQPEIPGPVAGIIAEPRNKSVLLDWDPPENDGGSSIINYIVEYSADNGTNWVEVENLDDSGNIVLDTNSTKNIISLINGVSYIFRIYAVNTVGKGIVSAETQPVTPISNSPTVPRQLSISGQSDGSPRPSINPTLQWIAPESAGNSPLDHYEVSYWIDDGITSTSKASFIGTDQTSSLSYTFQNIAVTGYVYFKVIAYNTNNIASNPVLYRSIGTDTDPRTTDSSAPNATNPYDFGLIECSGTCL